MIGVLAAIALALPQPTSPTPSTHSPAVLFSGEKAYQAGLANVCLPLISERKALSEVQAAEHLIQIDPGQAGAGPADHVYRLGSVDFTLVIAWADGTCSVEVQKGDAAQLRGAAAAVLAARPEGFSQGVTKKTSVGSDRTLWCAAARPQPVIVSVATPGASTVRGITALTSTVYRSGLADPPDCHP